MMRYACYVVVIRNSLLHRSESESFLYLEAFEHCISKSVGLYIKNQNVDLTG